jgi:acyl-CoA synthetase (AMP-forming)/AMP-acid ligase II
MESPATLPQALRDAATRYADHAAIQDGPTTIGFRQLLDEVRTMARAYVALGVRPRDRVALWAPNSWQWEVAALAVSYAGGTLVPVNTRYTGYEAVDLLHRTRARVAVVAEGFLRRSYVGELGVAAAEMGVELPTLVRLADWASLGSSAVRVPVDEVEARADRVLGDDVADILFTSGTTGRSKGACSAHRQTVAVARIWGELAGMLADDRYLAVNPFFHSFGYKAGIVVSLLHGTTLLPMATFDVTAALRLVESQRVTVLPGAPTVYQSLLDAPDRALHDLSSLRTAVTGAAVVPVALVERMQSELSFETVLTAFGMTECVVGTMCRPGDPDEVVARTCGRVVPGLELRIADPGGNAPLPPGEVGEVLFRGDTVMLGYLDDAEATAEAVDADGWLHSGDLGTVDEDGYLTITDRLKDVYIVGGFNVYPAEVEQVLARLDGVADSAVVGVPDDRLGEVGRAFVVRRHGSDLTTDDVVAFARDRLANFKVPRSVEFVGALPRNPSGKVLKRDLRSRSWTST